MRSVSLHMPPLKKVTASSDHATQCKKYRSITACNGAAEKCSWVKHLKCLPSSGDGIAVLPKSEEKKKSPVHSLVHTTNNKPNKPNNPRSASKQPLSARSVRCKKHRSIKACNESQECHWVKNLKCQPGKPGVKSASKSPKKPSPKLQKEKKSKESSTWLKWYCKHQESLDPYNSYCTGPKPRPEAEAKANVLKVLQGKCIDMMDPIMAEEFSADKPMEYLYSVVPLGENDKTGKKHCFDATFMLDILFQNMLVSRDKAKGLVPDPLTNKPLRMQDVNAIINANLKKRMLLPTHKKPCYLSGIYTYVKGDPFIKKTPNIFYSLNIITLKCTGEPFTSLSTGGVDAHRITVLDTGLVPDFKESDYTPSIKGFTYGSLIEALGIIVQHNRIRPESWSSKNTSVALYALSQLFESFTWYAGASMDKLSSEAIHRVYNAVKKDLQDIVKSSRGKVMIPAIYQ